MSNTKNTITPAQPALWVPQSYVDELEDFNLAYVYCHLAKADQSGLSSPSDKELADGLRILSESTISGYIKKLEDKDFIKTEMVRSYDEEGRCLGTKRVIIPLRPYGEPAA